MAIRLQADDLDVMVFTSYMDYKQLIFDSDFPLNPCKGHCQTRISFPIGKVIAFLYICVLILFVSPCN